MDGICAAHALLKAAAARGASRLLGQALRTGGRAAKGVYNAAGEIGAGVAEGLGSGAGGQEVGRLVGHGAALAGGYGAAKKGKNKVDEFRYRNGLYSGY